MNRDKYGEIINGDETYKEIKKTLERGHSIIIGWTDEKGTHYDILFTDNSVSIEDNSLQGGLKGNELFVSIIRKGAFGFRKKSEISPDYIAEKLNISSISTSIKLTELIENILK